MSEVATAKTCQVRSHFITPPAEFEGCFTTFYRLELDIEEEIGRASCRERV